MNEPEPMTPAACDLRDFPRMMIDIVRLRASEFDAIADDGAWRAGFNLWLSSWHQVPAASLADDDTQLVKLAGLGRDLRTWRKLKAEALRGWVKASDGRLYHKVVAEMALEAWIEKVAQRKSSGAGNARRYSHTFDPQPFDAALAEAVGMLAALNPQSKALSRRAAKALPVGAATPPTGSATGLPPGSQETGTVTGSRVVDVGVGASEPAAEVDYLKLADHVCRTAGVRNIDPGQIVRSQQIVREWLDAGAVFETDIIELIRDTVAISQVPIHSLNYFDAPVRQAIARRAAKAAGATGAGRPRRGNGLGMAEPATSFDETPEQIAAREQRLSRWEIDDGHAAAAH